MDKLKNYAKVIGTSAVLATGPVAVAQTDMDVNPSTENQTVPKTFPDVMLGPELKVTTKVGKFAVYGAVGMPIRPMPTSFHAQGKGPYSDLATYSIELPSRMTSLKAGIAIGNRNKIKAEVEVARAKKEQDFFYNGFNATLGYMHEKELSDKDVLSFYAGVSSGNLYFGPPDHNNTVYFDRAGLKINIKYEKKLSKRFSVFANAGYSLYNQSDLGQFEYVDHYFTNHEFSARVGLHLDLRPKLPNIGFEMPKRKPSKKSPRKKSHSKVDAPCYAYPKYNRFGNEGNARYIQPDRRNK